MTKKSIALTFALTAIASVAFAANLKPFQKEAQKSFDEEIKSQLDETNKACGVKLVVKSNFEALKAEEWANNSISSRCTEMLSAIATVCGKDAYKEELVKRIKEVHCLFGGKDSDDNAGVRANMSVTGSAFIYKMHPNNANLNDNAREVLEKALNE